MQLRRSLLLFAILLGLAALAASIAGPRREAGRTRPSPPPAPEPSPRVRSEPPALGQSTLRFLAGGPATTRTLAVGQPADVIVAVRQPGQVEVEGLGLTQAAEPVTPASFQVLVERPGRFEVRFDPAGRQGWSLVGTLVARPRAAIR